MLKYLSNIRQKRHSLSVRLSLWIVAFAILIFSVVLGFMFSQSRKVVRQEAIDKATQILDNTELRINTILERVKASADNTDWLIKRHLDAPDSMFVYSRRILQLNPGLNGCSIAFEPFYYPSRGQYFSAFSLRDKDTIYTTQEGNDQYEYFYYDWYQLCKLLDRPCWTEPFFDYNPEDIYSKDMIASYCKPIKDEKGNFVATLSVDLSLSWLSRTINAVKPYPNSYCIMIGQGGTFFVHPDTTKLFYETIFTETLLEPDTAISNLGYAMLRGEKGMRQLEIGGQKSYVFFKPLSDTGLSLALVCLESDIFGGYYKMLNMMITLFVIGLLLMYFIFSRTIANKLSPLRRLAKQTEKIASGNFDEKLADTKYNDEVGQLNDSFKHMQQSLVNYIDELKNTTASKAAMENELKVASDIQKSMLPKIFPPYPDRKDIDVFGTLIPAKEVGGDLFDFYIRDEKMFFCIGDVSGKGIPASLVMAMTRAMFRTVSSHESTPHHIIGILNDAMSEGNESNMFVTLFVGVLDLPTGRLRYCNAGHDAPILASDTTIKMLPVDSNIPIGVMKDWQFSAQEITIEDHSTIFLYTDGLTEAENIDHQLFGEERMMQVMETLKSKERPNPKNIITAMSDAVHEFVGEAQQSDDLTLLGIQYSKLQTETTKLGEITLTNDINEVPQLTEFIEKACEESGMDPATTMQINLAIEEAVVNVMNYAYPIGTKGDINIKAEKSVVMEESILTFIISDEGKPFDPTAKAEVDTNLSAEERPIGGLGIHLVRQLMDKTNYEYINGKNVLSLSKIITPLN